MSADRTKVRASSLVGLYRSVTIEGLPIKEVKADLKRLGVDPASSIELAQRLAEGDVADPATALLHRLAEAEEIDAEIADLENAPIDEIRSILPEGVAEEVSVAAKDRAVDEERVEADVSTDGVAEKTVVPMKRRRLAVLGWSGSLIGVAASIALFVVIRVEIFDDVELAGGLRSSLEEVDPLASGDVADQVEPARPFDGNDVEAEASPPPIAQGRRRLPEAVAASPATKQPEAVLETAVAEADSDAGATVDETRERSGIGREEQDGLLPAERAIPPALSDDKVEAVRKALKDAIGDGSSLLATPSPAERSETANAEEPPSHLPAAKPTPNARELAALIATRVIARERTVGSAESEAPPAADISSLPVLPDNVTGVFIVDAEGVPPVLWALASVKPDDRLASKVAEASLRALGRKVLALVAFERDGERVEAVLVESALVPQPADLAPQTTTAVTAFADVTPPSSVAEQPSFELIELPVDR